MKLKLAQSIAVGIVARLQPACDKVQVAGSVRRQVVDVKDIEIVALPILDNDFDALDMFGGAPGAPVPLPNRFNQVLDELMHDRLIILDQQTPRNGPKYKRFIVNPDDTDRVALDLFIADVDNYGLILALRTGNSQFSKALVTPRRAGGLMPGHLVQRGGYLWHGNDRVVCRDEETYFGCVGIRWVEPQFRDANAVMELIRGHWVGE